MHALQLEDFTTALPYSEGPYCSLGPSPFWGYSENLPTSYLKSDSVLNGVR